jgi:uncharacterized protein (TIGR02246 family)
MSAHDEARALVARINEAWRGGRAEAAAPLFAEDVVMLGPGGERLVGRAAMVRSYVDFAAAATVDEYEESEHAVDVFGDTAVVSYAWRMAWRAGGEAYRERGRDVFVLAHGADGWQAVWRTLIAAGAA